jgi:hypothetical protein
MNHEIPSLGARAVCALLFVGATACAASDGSSDPGSVGEGVDELSVTFVTLRPDLRRCVSPLCGGYFVRDVNRELAERYVSGLEFDASMPADAIDDVRSAPASELVLRGHLGRPDTRFRTRPFVVLDAFRGMPGVTPHEGAAFYLVHARKPPNECFVAPCPNEIASLLNTSTQAEFDRVSVDRAALLWVDKGWLAARVEGRGAVAAGTLEQGAHFPGGFEEVLEASQVFVRLPDRTGPCPLLATQSCAEGTVAVDERTEDRCIMQVACVKPGLCPLFEPRCAPGYTLSSWLSPPSGCPAFACDPSFVVE